MFARATVFRSRYFSIVNTHCFSVYTVSDISKQNDFYSRISSTSENLQPSLSIGIKRGQIRLSSNLVEGKLESQQFANIVKLSTDNDPLKLREIQSCAFCASPSHEKLDELNQVETDLKPFPWRGQPNKEESKEVENDSMNLRSTLKTVNSSPVQSSSNDPNFLDITNNKFAVNSSDDKLRKEDLEKFSHIRKLVRQLNEALNVEQHHNHHEKELQKQLEIIKTKLEPLETQKHFLELNAGRTTSLAKWVGLSLMGMQFGILARLTWWEYSWDIMEPVTYFVTFGTAMGVYAYHAVIKHPSQKEYLDRVFLNEVYKRAKAGGFPLDEYNGLKNECARLEHDLEQLKNPLNLAYKG